MQNLDIILEVTQLSPQMLEEVQPYAPIRANETGNYINKANPTAVYTDADTLLDAIKTGGTGIIKANASISDSYTITGVVILDLLNMGSLNIYGDLNITGAGALFILNALNVTINGTITHSSTGTINFKNIGIQDGFYAGTGVYVNGTISTNRQMSFVGCNVVQFADAVSMTGAAGALFFENIKTSITTSALSFAATTGKVLEFRNTNCAISIDSGLVFAGAAYCKFVGDFDYPVYVSGNFTQTFATEFFNFKNLTIDGGITTNSQPITLYNCDVVYFGGRINTTTGFVKFSKVKDLTLDGGITTTTGPITSEYCTSVSIYSSINTTSGSVAFNQCGAVETDAILKGSGSLSCTDCISVTINGITSTTNVSMTRVKSISIDSSINLGSAIMTVLDCDFSFSMSSFTGGSLTITNANTITIEGNVNLGLLSIFNCLSANLTDAVVTFNSISSTATFNKIRNVYMTTLVLASNVVSMNASFLECKSVSESQNGDYTLPIVLTNGTNGSIAITIIDSTISSFLSISPISVNNTQITIYTVERSRLTVAYLLSHTLTASGDFTSSFITCASDKLIAGGTNYALHTSKVTTCTFNGCRIRSNGDSDLAYGVGNFDTFFVCPNGTSSKLIFIATTFKLVAPSGVTPYYLFKNAGSGIGKIGLNGVVSSHDKDAAVSPVFGSLVVTSELI